MDEEDSLKLVEKYTQMLSSALIGFDAPSDSEEIGCLIAALCHFNAALIFTSIHEDLLDQAVGIIEEGIKKHLELIKDLEKVAQNDSRT